MTWGASFLELSAGDFCGRFCASLSILSIPGLAAGVILQHGHGDTIPVLKVLTRSLKCSNCAKVSFASRQAPMFVCSICCGSASCLRYTAKVIRLHAMSVGRATVARTGGASHEGVHRQALHHAAWKGHGFDHMLVNNDVPTLAKGSDKSSAESTKRRISKFRLMRSL